MNLPRRRAGDRTHTFASGIFYAHGVKANVFNGPVTRLGHQRQVWNKSP